MGLTLVAVLLFGIAASVIAAINLRQLDKQQSTHNAGDVEIAQDRVGGSTPQEALSKFADAIERGDGVGAAELSVPALRDHLRASIESMDADERSLTANQMRAASQSVGAESVVEGSVVITEPVYVDLVKYPSGVWKVASL